MTVVSFSGMTCRLELTGEETEGRVTVIEMTIEPGAGAPLHVSPGEDKYFRVLHGTFDFQAGDERRLAREGDTLRVARGVVHGFTSRGDRPGALLLVSTPAGHDAFFRDMAALPVPHTPSDVEEVCRRHGQVITGDRL